METPNQTTEPAAPAAAPVASATPATGATPTAPAAPAPKAEPAVASKHNPKVKGSDAQLAKRFNASKAKELGAEENTPAAADEKSAPAKSTDTPAEPVKADEAAAPAESLDLAEHVEKLAKEGKPLKYTAEGKEHEIKSAVQLRNLLSRAHDHGRVSRELGALQKHVSYNYAPYDQAIESRPGFADVVTTAFNQPELDQYLTAIINGKASPELADAIAKGVPLKNPDRIKANVLSRQVEGRTEAETRLQQERAKEEQLATLANEYGVKWLDEAGNPIPEDKRLYDELKAKVLSGEAKDWITAFKLSDRYASYLQEKAVKAAEEKAKQEREAALSRQKQLERAEGMTTGGTKNTTTPKKGSDADMIARFNRSRREALS